MKGAPLLGVLQRAIKRAEERRSLKESTLIDSRRESNKRQEYKVTVLEKGHPEYERFLALGNQLINNVETALDDIHQELQRLAGRVSRSEYDWDNAIDYVELYSLDPQVKKRKIDKQMYEEEEEEENSDSSSYS